MLLSYIQLIACSFLCPWMYHNSHCLVYLTARTATDEDDNTKEETAKMLREYENLKDSTKDERTPVESGECRSQDSQRDERL